MSDFSYNTEAALARKLQAEAESLRVKAVAEFSCVAGVTVNEVREYAGLSPCENETIGRYILNLPHNV